MLQKLCLGFDLPSTVSNASDFLTNSQLTRLSLSLDLGTTHAVSVFRALKQNTSLQTLEFTSIIKLI